MAFEGVPGSLTFEGFESPSYLPRRHRDYCPPVPPFAGMLKRKRRKRADIIHGYHLQVCRRA